MNVKEIKTDLVVGALTGFIFSQVYCFYSQPIEFKNLEIAKKFKNRPALYYLNWGVRMPIAFGLIRSISTATMKK